MEKNESTIESLSPRKRRVGSRVSRVVPLCLAVMSLVCATWALFAFPLVGLVGILLGYSVYRQEKSLGSTCMILSGVSVLIGIMMTFMWRLYP